MRLNSNEALIAFVSRGAADVPGYQVSIRRVECSFDDRNDLVLNGPQVPITELGKLGGLKEALEVLISRLQNISESL